MVLYVQQYSYEIEHCRRSDNEVADYISRVCSIDVVKVKDFLIVANVVNEVTEKRQWPVND